MTQSLPERTTTAAAAERSGDWSTATAEYSRLFARAVEEGDLAEAANALRGEARVRLQQREYEAAEELAQFSLEISERNGLLREAARAVNVLAMICQTRTDLPTAELLYGRALELALEVGDDLTIGYACQNLGVVANILGNLREARVRYLESIGSFVRSGNKTNAMMAYNNLGMVCADLQEWMESELFFGRGIEIAERLGNSALLGRLHVNLAEPLIHVGEHVRAAEALQRAEDLAAQIGDVDVLAAVERFRGVIAHREGGFAAAERHLEHSLEIASRADLYTERAPTLEEMAKLRWSEGREDEARVALGQARDAFASIGAEWDSARVKNLLTEWESQARSTVPEPIRAPA